MDIDDDYFLPLTGSPKPKHLYSHPNNDQGDFISDIQVCNNFGFSITSKGTAYIHKVPNFECVNSHTIRNFSTCQIQDDDHIIVLHTTRPLIYNTEFEVTTDYLKRPTFQSATFGSRTEAPTYVCSSYDNNLFVAVTSSSAICLWDVRTDESPRVLTISKNINIQTVSMKNDIIAIGHETGKISILDSRNMIKRMNQIDFSSQLKTPREDSSLTVDDQNNPFHVIPTQYRRAPIQNHEFRISQSEREPWIVGFQYINGPAGIIDLMSKKVTHQINPPPYEENPENRFSKPRPLFNQNTFCVSYRWSHVLQVIDYTALNFGYDYYNDEEPLKPIIKMKKERSIFSSSDDDELEPSSSGVPIEEDKPIQQKEREAIDLNKYRTNIQMEICPAYLCGCEDIDGIYAASSLGDIFHVF